MNLIYKILKVCIILALTVAIVVPSTAQWQKMTNIPPPFNQASWLDIYFLKTNPDYGWICGWLGNVIRTTDRGKTWQGTKITDVQNNNLQLECIRFADEHTGYTSGSGKIFKSVDGGATWFDVTDPRANELWGNYFCSPDTGIVVGGGCGTEQNFFRTTDGGISWNLYQAYEPNSGLTHVLLYKGDGLGFATSSGRLWETTNGGLSWFIIAVTGQNDWQEQIAHFGNSFLLPFSGDCTGGGGRGGMRFSTNGGATWRQFSTGCDMFGCFLVDSLIGWGCGWKRTIIYTPDGGNTWSMRNCGIDEKDNLDDLWFIDDSTGFAVGTGVWKFVGFDKIQAKIDVKGDTVICDDQTTTLTALGSYLHYKWSTGDTVKAITVKQPGVYTLQVWNSYCDSALPAKVTISLRKKPTMTVLSTNSSTFCEGDSTVLSTSFRCIYYKWSTGDTTPKITVHTSGKYSVDVIDSSGCKNSATIQIQSIPKPNAKILSSGPVRCVGDSVILSSDRDYFAYKWFALPSPAVISASKSIVVKTTGEYKLEVFTKEGCSGNADSVLLTFKVDTNAVSITATLTKGVIYYDSVHVFSSKCLPVTVQNVGSKDLTINNLNLKINVAFSVPQSQFPFVLTPGASRDVIICFSPTKLGAQYDTLFFEDRCSPHVLVLKALSLANVYYGDADCGVNLVFKSKTVQGKYTVAIGKPYPSPSVNIVNIPVSATYMESAGNFSTGAKIFDLLGREQNTNIDFTFTSEKNESGTNVSGMLTMNFTGLNSGVYYTNLTIFGESFVIPVIIGN